MGTSHGAPLPGRHCQSILIETDAGAYLFDAGAPVTDLLVNDGFDLSRLRAVFVTHMHSDHFDGLPGLVCLASWFYVKMRFGVYLPEESGIDAVRAFCRSRLENEYHWDKEESEERIPFRLYRAGVVYDDGNLKVTACPTEHLKRIGKPAYGFLVEADGKRVYITGDMHKSLSDFPAFLSSEGVDLLISECAHFDPEALAEKLKDCKTDAVAVIHVFPLRRFSELHEIEPTVPARMIYPADGDELPL